MFPNTCKPCPRSIHHPQVRQPGIVVAEPCQDQLPAITILHIGGMDDDREDKAFGIHQQMAFSSGYPLVGHLLAAVVAAEPPFSVVGAPPGPV
ncbi:hypothetical protein BH23CHL2_BH23CHL2_33090 [soil metagenome]